MSVAAPIAQPTTCPAPTTASLSESERVARLRLARSVNVGPRTYAHLLRRFGNAVRALGALPSLAAAGGKGGYVACPLADVEAETEAGRVADATMILLGDADYSTLLSEIGHPPQVLWVIGGHEIFRRPAIAIVGARNAPALGLRTARNLSRPLGGAGQVIVSGSYGPWHRRGGP